jgi:hypothetical protein
MSERSERIIETVFAHWCPVEIDGVKRLHESMVHQ